MAPLEAAGAADLSITQDAEGGPGQAPRRRRKRRVVKPFTDFGRSDFTPRRGQLHSIAVAKDFADVRRQMRDACPALPGVYGMVDRHRELVYVGVSSKLRKRLVTYFQGGEALRKERCVAAQARQLVWEVVGHEFVAHLRELELIRRFQPRLNVKGRWPARPLGYIYISQEDAPRLRVARRVPKAVRYYWGPLGLGWRIREAVEVVNRLFKLCDCPASVPMHFAEQQHLFSLDLRLECLRGEIGTCLGPCAGRCTRDDYTAQLNAARAFLNGKDRGEVVRLEQTMHEAVALRQYERAANARDTLDRLEALSSSLALLRRPPVPDEFVYPVRIRRRAVWYFIAEGKVALSAPAPANLGDAERCVRILEKAYRQSGVERLEVDRHAKHIVSHWFRRHPGELESALSPAEARDHCAKLLAGSRFNHQDSNR